MAASPGGLAHDAADMLLPPPAPAPLGASNHHFGFPLPPADAGEPTSPLLFKRTPGALGDGDGGDSERRFNSWINQTSPYAGGKTPPTASMRSVAPGDEENTPPRHARDLLGGGVPGSASGSQQHFAAWLRATNAAAWTPRRGDASPGATPPRAPAPSPACSLTPMSVARASAASPAAMSARSVPRSRALPGPLLPDSGDSDSGSEFDDAATTVGASELAAAARRATAASHLAAAAAAAAGGPPAATPPRGAAGSSWRGEPAAAAAQAAGDSLATPLSHMSVSRRDAAGAAAPASPAEKLIGLMLQQQGQPSGSGQAQHTPSRLAGVHHHRVPPPSPAQAVIDLMLLPPQAEAAAAAGVPASASGSAASSAYASAASTAGDVASGEASDWEAASERGSDDSGDEIELGELSRLCGNSTPLSDILGLMLSPPPASGLTPRLGGGGGGGAAAQLPLGEDGGVGPRVLFADD